MPVLYGLFRALSYQDISPIEVDISPNYDHIYPNKREKWYSGQPFLLFVNMSLGDGDVYGK